jgi:hypothetical protein
MYFRMHLFCSSLFYWESQVIKGKKREFYSYYLFSGLMSTSFRALRGFHNIGRHILSSGSICKLLVQTTLFDTTAMHCADK